MKSKTKTYILLTSALIIWGIIGYKITSTITPNSPKISSQNEIANFVPKKTIEADTFSIQKVNRDPFLGTLYKKKPIVKVKSKPPTKTFTWLPIIYHGVISKKQSNSQIFIISISGQQSFMKVGQKINGVKLLKGNGNTITVSYKNKTKSITKT